MLDVSRHVMPVDGILRLLDNMAAHKLNSFHWHLTDDQGWRLESRRYPRLTEIGAWRRGADGVLTPGNAPEKPPGPGTYGGFYTHDDVKKVVAHATKLHINVIPEIEMPGHAVAALAAYPHLSCAGGTFEPAIRTGVFHDVYCAGNEATFEFLQGVLEELLPLFPGKYIHVGGDECPKDRWKTCPKCQTRIRSEDLKDEHELQSYVIRRIEKFLAGHGKRLLGWDEILEGGLPPGATVMSWRGTEGGIAAARAGHDVVMTPNQFCYLDYRQASEGEPTAIAHGLLPLEKTYSYDPIPTELNAEQAKHILGLQGNVWTEYMPDMKHVEYMIWPRAAAIAEIGWSGAANKIFEDFRRRAQANEVRLAARGSSFRKI
jgi:hexosaminidase